MLVAGFPAGAWGTNCYVLATGPGTECLVIDPGQDAAEGVDQIVNDNRLKPIAVLLTHGHIDHMWSVLPVCGTYDSTAYIHPADRHLLTDPMAGIGRETAAMLLGGDYTFAEPDDVVELTDGTELELAGLPISVDHTPGHTPGSIVFNTPYDGPDSTFWGATPRPPGSVSKLLFSGDVLFAGSIGRTDLPGGDHQVMLHTLATKILPLDDDIVVLPGHGGQTTIGREKDTNPYLQHLETHA